MRQRKTTRGHTTPLMQDGKKKYLQPRVAAQMPLLPCSSAKTCRSVAARAAEFGCKDGTNFPWRENCITPINSQHLRPTLWSWLACEVIQGCWGNIDNCELISFHNCNWSLNADSFTKYAWLQASKAASTLGGCLRRRKFP
jgi:hypothetical protein